MREGAVLLLVSCIMHDEEVESALRKSFATHDACNLSIISAIKDHKVFISRLAIN
jgi:hypothetical protein